MIDGLHRLTSKTSNIELIDKKQSIFLNTYTKNYNSNSKKVLSQMLFSGQWLTLKSFGVWDKLNHAIYIDDNKVLIF